MKTIVVYKSKTGFTRRYAEWIGEALGCEVVSIRDINKEMLLQYDFIIHGGWIMGGMISGLEEIKRMVPDRLITFGVGYSKTGECEDNIKTVNHLEKIPFFYMEGGFHPKEMGFFQKLIVKAVTKKPVVEEDRADKRYIEPLVDYVNHL